MNCKRVQRALSVQAADAGTTDKGVALHLQKCDNCAAFAAHLERLEARLAAWEESRPSPALENRIACLLDAERSLPAAHGKKPSRFWPGFKRSGWNRLKENRAMNTRLSWGAALVMAGVILAISRQTGSANTPLKRMGRAARGVHSIHLVGWVCELAPEVAAAVESGDDHRSVTDVFPRRYEAWIKDGRWRETVDNDVTTYEAGKAWKNGVPEANGAKPPLLASFAFRAITGDEPFGKGVEYTTELLGDTVQDGHTVIKLQIESKAASGAEPETAPERRIFWVDPQTYLPVRMEEVRYENDRWATDAILWFDYDQPVSETLFDPTGIKSERQAPGAGAHTMRGYYRLTNEQYARWLQINNEDTVRQQSIEADRTLSRAQKDRLLVQETGVFMDRVSRIMDQDQRRLWNDWLPVQAEMLHKLMTPQQRKEDAEWRRQQQRLFDAWLATQDDRTRQLLQGHSGL